MDSLEFTDLPRNDDDLVFGIAGEFLILLFNFLACGAIGYGMLVVATDWGLRTELLPLAIICGPAAYAVGRFKLESIDYHRFYRQHSTSAFWVLIPIHIPTFNLWEVTRATEAHIIASIADALDLRDVDAWRASPYSPWTVGILLTVGLGVFLTTLKFFVGGAGYLVRRTGVPLEVLTAGLLAGTLLVLLLILVSDINSVRALTWHTSLVIAVSRLVPATVFFSMVLVFPTLPSSLTAGYVALPAVFRSYHYFLEYAAVSYLTITTAVATAAHCSLIAYDSVQLRFDATQ